MKPQHLLILFLLDACLLCLFWHLRQYPESGFNYDFEKVRLAMYPMPQHGGFLFWFTSIIWGITFWLTAICMVLPFVCALEANPPPHT